MVWTALRIEIAADLADAVTNFLVEEGASSVLEEDGATGAGRVQLETALAGDAGTRIADRLGHYLEHLAAFHPAAGQASIETAPVASLDWAAVARSHHRPVVIGQRLVVAPPWDVPDAPGRCVLVIEPGQAFGTGQHATTRSCLEAIEATLATRPVEAALDVGTGSGILALALARLGVPRVVALDDDCHVLPRARDNLVRNGARQVQLLAGTVAALRATFDLVVANLLADTLVQEATALAAVTAEHGTLVVSGLLAAQADVVRAAYPGWRCTDERRADGWSTLVLGRIA